MARASDTHVVPCDDWLEHPSSVTCPCRPRIVFECPINGRVIVHNAFDGREWFSETDIASVADETRH